MASTYDIGDTVRLRATYTDTGGAPADPTTVTFVYEDPSGNTSTMVSGSSSVINSTVGTFYADLEADEAGLWEYRATATGTIVASEEGYFIVRARRVP